MYTLALLYPLLVGILLSRQMAGSALLDNPASSWLGRASAHVYLYHAAIRKVLTSLGAAVGPGAALAAMLGGSLALFVATDLAGRAWGRLSAERGWRPSQASLGPKPPTPRRPPQESCPSHARRTRS